ncbi:hypothetical protein [Methanoregula sp.]|uniref:hypothetical protein n=1 Tax=Methanoregula sp. TaxID=2052170 RepID=UPI003562FA85
MNETIIITSEMAINWLSNFSLLFQLICSFLIAFFTISYSLYLREKRDFEAAIACFLAETGFFQTCVETDLKPSIISHIKKIKSHPDERTFGLMQFPSISFSSIEFLLTHGYILQLGQDNFDTLITLKYQLAKLEYQKSGYFLLLNYPERPLTTVEFNNGSYYMLIAMKDLLDAIDISFQKF